MSMHELQKIRKERAHLSAERQALKKKSVNLRIAERDAKNEVLGEFLERGNFENTHGDVKRVHPRWTHSLPDELQNMLADWNDECAVYDAARQRLIDQKVKLLYGLKDRAEDLTQFIAINFRANRKEV